MIKNLKFYKRLVSGLLVFSIMGTGITSYSIFRNLEKKRVKGYLEDFLTEDNFVDLTKISTNYEIKNFSGKCLAEVLEKSSIDYVRIADSYICDDEHKKFFKQVNAVNYDNFLWEDKEGNKYYEMYEPKRDSSESGISYDVPEGFQLEYTECSNESIKFDDLDDYIIEVFENTYEDSYSLSLERKR